ncbi:nuclease-related domain-containing protein [Rossellomorea aquimaris]
MKERGIPQELQLLRGLRPRMNFSESEESYYLYKEKGYEGEMNFDKWAVPLSKKMIFLNDINLNQNNNNFQVDSFGISSGTLHHFEVKNLEGDYSIEKGKWTSPSGNPVKNPLLQVDKTETHLNQLVKNYNIPLSVKSHLIFINPEFHLYDVPSNLPIIYPAQMNRFRNNLLQNSSKIRNADIRAAEKLLSLSIGGSPYNSVPKYSYEELRKGIVCSGCGEFYTEAKRILHCEFCGVRESCSDAVLRSVEEFGLLFPDFKVTTKNIFDWCKVIKDERTVQRVLRSNLQMIGNKRSSYYIKGTREKE